MTDLHGVLQIAQPADPFAKDENRSSMRVVSVAPCLSLPYLKIMNVCVALYVQDRGTSGCLQAHLTTHVQSHGLLPSGPQQHVAELDSHYAHV